MSDIELVKVNPDVLGTLWKRIQPVMKSAYETSNGRLDAASTFKMIHDGTLKMWCIYDDENDIVYGLVGTSVTGYETGKKFLTIHFCVGRDRKKWMHLLETIEQYGRDKGCTGIDFWCRKGWQSELPDYKMTHVLLEKDL